MMQPASIDFKYKFVKGGHPQGFRATKGSVSPDRMMLGDAQVPYEDILETTTRDSRLIIQMRNGVKLPDALATNVAQPNILVLQVTGTPTLGLEKTVDRYASAAAAKAHRHQLSLIGQEHEFRSMVCPHCQATIDLTGFDKTHHVYCRYCESVLSEFGDLVTNGDEYRMCDECGMFDRIRGFNEFYFYFLLIIYGFRQNRRFLCDDCALKMTRRMFWINFIFILGLFPTLFNRIKIATGKKAAFKALAKANNLAKRGKVDEAEALYGQIHGVLENHPGILYNQAIANSKGSRSDGLLTNLDRALKSCNNHGPSLHLLNRLQHAAQQSAQHPA